MTNEGINLTRKIGAIIIEIRGLSFWEFSERRVLQRVLRVHQDMWIANEILRDFDRKKDKSNG